MLRYPRMEELVSIIDQRLRASFKAKASRLTSIFLRRNSLGEIELLKTNFNKVHPYCRDKCEMRKGKQVPVCFKNLVHDVISTPGSHNLICPKGLMYAGVPVDDLRNYGAWICGGYRPDKCPRAELENDPLWMKQPRLRPEQDIHHINQMMQIMVRDALRLRLVEIIYRHDLSHMSYEFGSLLLSGGVFSRAEGEVYLNRLALPSFPTRVVVAEIFPIAETMRESEADFSNPGYVERSTAVLNTLLEDWPGYLIVPKGALRYAVLLCERESNNSALSDLAASETAVRIREVLAEVHSRSVLMGMGAPAKHFIDIPASYHQALDALYRNRPREEGVTVYEEGWLDVGEIMSGEEAARNGRELFLRDVRIRDFVSARRSAGDLLFALEELWEKDHRSFARGLFSHLLLEVRGLVSGDISHEESEQMIMLMDRISAIWSVEELGECIADLVVFAENIGAPGRIRSDEVVKYARRYINNHIARQISLSQMSRVMGISQTHLGRLFKKETSLSFGKFVVTTKVERAKAIMQTDPNISIKEVADRVGYPISTSFTRAFERFEGTSPADYRQKLRNA